MRALLLGKDHTEIGAVAIEAPADGIALALTRGLHAKTWAYTDPNEDAVAAVIGERATLLVLADGHNGWTSTEASVTAVLDAVGDDPPPDLGDHEFCDLFWQAHRAILAGTQAEGAEHPDSRTTLVVALVAGRKVQWGSFGDSTVYVASQASDGRLNRRQQRFLGYAGMPRGALDAMLERGVERVGQQEFVVLASDGFSDFARPFPAQLFNGDCGAADVARGLVTAAFDGGAGDNVAVAVIGPGAVAGMSGGAPA